jgi:hypothetical protein
MKKCYICRKEMYDDEVNAAILYAYDLVSYKSLGPLFDDFLVHCTDPDPDVYDEYDRAIVCTGCTLQYLNEKVASLQNDLSYERDRYIDEYELRRSQEWEQMGR